MWEVNVALGSQKIVDFVLALEFCGDGLSTDLRGGRIVHGDLVSIVVYSFHRESRYLIIISSISTQLKAGVDIEIL